MLTLRRPFPTILTVVVAYGLLAMLLATAPQNAFGFWPGFLAGVILAAIWRAVRTPPNAAQTQLRLWRVGGVLAVFVTLAFISQRDLPVAVAPLGLLVAWTGALALDRYRSL